MNTIYILWLRQIKRYRRSPARIISSLGQPLLFLLALGFGFGPIYAKAGGGNYIQFLAPGVITMTILFTAVFSGIETIWDKQFGFLKETLVAPVSRFSIMMGRTLGGATIAVMQGVIVMIISLAAGFRPDPTMWPVAFLFMVLSGIIFTAMGTWLATLVTDMQAFPLIMNFLVMPMFFLSGALFPLDNAPGALYWIARFDPLTYGVDGLRGAFISQSHFGLGMDLAVLLVAAAIFIALGSRSFAKMEA